MRFLSCLLLFAACSSGPAGADPYLSPQEAVKKMTVPPGFSVDLIASEPDLVQPVAFAWDARGRIWVVEARTYPKRRGQPPAEERKAGEDLTKPSDAQLKDIFGGDDSILIFEDSDGDGSFETRKVFAEKLNLVSGIEIGFGGVYVGAAPYLLHLPDRDADDKPDGPPVILLDGWGYQDTHETLNSFIWGPDGWLYGCHGVFTHSNVGVVGVPPSGGIINQSNSEGAKKEQDSLIPPKGGTPTATARTPLNCAYWRYHPVRRVFEVFAHGTSNSWGFDYNDLGDWFSEACVIPHFWHIIQGGYYLRQSNPLGHFNPYVYTNIETIADHQHYIGATPHGGNAVSDAAGGGHAHCGLCIYNGDNFPPEYRGRAMMFNIHGQRINQENLVPQGSGYVAKHLPDFLKANDKNFTGVALKVGPDGAVYFIDWYDQQKCHLPQAEKWDRSNGRLYRVKYDRTWKPWKGDVAEEKLSKLVENRLSMNGWLRRASLKLVAEKWNAASKDPGKLMLNDPVAGKAFDDALAGGKKVRDTADYYTAAQLLELFGEGSSWPIALAAEGTSIFGNCLALATDTQEGALEIPGAHGLMNPSEYFLSLALDKPINPQAGKPSARVRLAIASALQRLPLSDRWPIAEALVQHGEDATDHNLPQMYWYAIEPLVPANPEKALELAAKSKIPLVSQNILRRLAESEGGVEHLIAAVAREKTGAGMVHLLKAATAGLRGRVGVAAPNGWEAAYNNVSDVLARREDARPLAGQIEDLRTSLAVAFGDRRAFPRLRDQVRDATQPVERRELALQVLVQGKDPELGALVQALLDDPALRLAALKALPQAMESLPGK